MKRLQKECIERRNMPRRNKIIQLNDPILVASKIIQFFKGHNFISRSHQVRHLINKFYHFGPALSFK